MWARFASGFFSSMQQCGLLVKNIFAYKPTRQLHINEVQFSNPEILAQNWSLSAISLPIPLNLPVHPSTQRVKISDPAQDKSLIGLILDLPLANTIPFTYDGPNTNQDPIILPTLHPEAPEMQAGGGRNLRHRRRSMKKHWRKKHFRRGLVIYRKRERWRKLAAEKVFRDRLTAAIRDAESFNAKEFVENFLANVRSAEKQQAFPLTAINDVTIQGESGEKKSPDVADSLKKTKGPYVHWTELITVEQLYGLKPSKFIDINAGKVNDDEWEEILRLRKQYEQTFKQVQQIDEKGKKASDS